MRGGAFAREGRGQGGAGPCGRASSVGRGRCSGRGPPGTWQSQGERGRVAAEGRGWGAASVGLGIASAADRGHSAGAGPEGGLGGAGTGRRRRGGAGAGVGRAGTPAWGGAGARPAWGGAGAGASGARKRRPQTFRSAPRSQARAGRLAARVGGRLLGVRSPAPGGCWGHFQVSPGGARPRAPRAQTRPGWGDRCERGPRCLGRRGRPWGGAGGARPVLRGERGSAVGVCGPCGAGWEARGSGSRAERELLAPRARRADAHCSPLFPRGALRAWGGVAVRAEARRGPGRRGTKGGRGLRGKGRSWEGRRERRVHWRKPGAAHWLRRGRAVQSRPRARSGPGRRRLRRVRARRAAAPASLPGREVAREREQRSADGISGAAARGAAG